MMEDSGSPPDQIAPQHQLSVGEIRQVVRGCCDHGSLEAPSENGWMVRGHGLIHSHDLISYLAFMLPTTESLFHAVKKTTCQSSASSVQCDTLINTKGKYHRFLSLGCIA